MSDLNMFETLRPAIRARSTHLFASFGREAARDDHGTVQHPACAVRRARYDLQLRQQVLRFGSASLLTRRVAAQRGRSFHVNTLEHLIILS